jgi:hypothetical protein
MNFYPQVYTGENPMRMDAICKANSKKKPGSTGLGRSSWL